MSKDSLSIIDLKQMKNEIDTILDRIIKNREQKLEQESIFFPNLDIIESDEKLKINIELPGVNKKDIEITYYKNHLEIKGIKYRKKQAQKDLKFLRIERSFGEFIEIIEVPKAINAKLSEAYLKNGILTIVLPKVSEKRGRVKINID